MTDYYLPSGSQVVLDHEAFAEAYTVNGHRHAFGEASRFVDLPDPDSAPEAWYESMFFDEIVEDIDNYYREMYSWERDMQERLQWEQGFYY